MTVSTEDMKEIQSWFPELRLSDNGSKISGEFSFRALYDGKQLHLYPKYGQAEKIFSGCYEIEVQLQSLGKYGLPNVYESGNRINRIAEHDGKPLSDFHVNYDSTCCLSVFTENEAAKITPVRLFNEVVFSFFAWQAYYESFHEKAPWGEYSHYGEGEREHQNEQDEKMKGVSRNAPCPCGSGKKYKYCCLDEFSSLMRRAR